MTKLWERITRVDARVWFACALVLSAAGYVGSEESPLPWVIVHALILAAIWRGSRNAWALLVTVSAVYASLLVIFGIATLFDIGAFVDIRWWGPVEHGAALLALAAFRGSRARSVQAEGAYPDQAHAPA